MAEINQKEIGAAELYASSMLELAEGQGQADGLLDELLELDRYMSEKPEFADFMTSLMVDPEKRERSIENIFRKRASDLLVDTLQILNRRGRTGLLHSIVEAYRLAHESLRNQVDVLVRTAVPLTDEFRARIRDAASAYSGKEPQLIEEVDESLLGGVVLQIGDRKIDNSVATKLRTLRQMLLERASYEIHSGKHAFKE